MTKFNKRELISNCPNFTCINLKLNSNKPILCSKSGMHPTEAIKVAEHSFRARSCLRNSARAQILHKNKHGINSTIILFQFPRYLFYFCFTNEYNVLMVLLFYYKGMLEKVTMQRTQQFSAFVCYRKNPVKCSACVVSRKNCD